MRQVLSLSLSQQKNKEIKALSKKRGFPSVSAYIKYLTDLDKELISEQALLNSIKQARKEYKNKKTITADSMQDLL